MALLLKNRFLLMGLMVAAAIMVHCSHIGAKESEKAVCVKPDPNSINPNGSSELSVLMRKMLQTAQNDREKVIEGVLPENFPEDFLKINTAKPTDNATKKESFTGFSDNYIRSLRTFYQSPKDELQKNFNALVISCVACHGDHCPGPLKVINKLKLPE